MSIVITILKFLTYASLGAFAIGVIVAMGITVYYATRYETTRDGKHVREMQSKTKPIYKVAFAIFFAGFFFAILLVTTGTYVETRERYGGGKESERKIVPEKETKTKDDIAAERIMNSDKNKSLQKDSPESGISMQNLILGVLFIAGGIVQMFSPRHRIMLHERFTRDFNMAMSFRRFQMLYQILATIFILIGVLLLGNAI